MYPIYGPKGRSASKKNYFAFLNYLLILLSRRVLNCLSASKVKNKDHIILDVTKSQAFLDMDSLKMKKGNYVLGYMIDKAGKDFLILDEAVQPKVTDGARIKLNRDHLCGKGKRKNRYFGEPVLLNYFFSSALKQKRAATEKHLESELKEVGKACKGEEKTLVDIYLSFRGATRFYLTKYLAYKRFFSKHTFKTVSTVDENSPAIRSILDAARVKDIKTIGINMAMFMTFTLPICIQLPDRDRHAFPDTLSFGGISGRNSWSKKEITVKTQ